MEEVSKATDSIGGIAAIAIVLALIPLFLELFHTIVHDAYRATLPTFHYQI